MPAHLAPDTALDADIVPSPEPRHEGPPKTVLVTGGTGFLGAFLIADLLRQTDASVYCLVRADDPVGAKRRLTDNLARYRLAPRDVDTRLFAVVGDVGRPHLGLDRPTFDWLADHIDAIYHLAASVSFMPAYEHVKAINVGGLKEILRLACARRTKAVHYTSTYAVFNTEAYGLARTVFETPLTGSSAGLARGYDQSKWVAEHLVYAAQQRGIPVTLYRAGFVSGDSSSGVHNRMDPVAQVFAVALCTGTAFPIEALLHLTPVDFCSTALVRLSRDPRTTNQIYHLVQEQPLTCMEVVAWLQDEGYPLRVVDFAAWYAQLKALCQTYPAFLPVLYLFSRPDNTLFAENENISSLQFDATHVRRHLAPPYHCPRLESGLLRRYFAYIADGDRGYRVLPRTA